MCLPYKAFYYNCGLTKLGFVGFTKLGLVYFYFACMPESLAAITLLVADSSPSMCPCRSWWTAVSWLICRDAPHPYQHDSWERAEAVSTIGRYAYCSYLNHQTGQMREENIISWYNTELKTEEQKTMTTVCRSTRDNSCKLFFTPQQNRFFSTAYIPLTYLLIDHGLWLMDYCDPYIIILSSCLQL